MVIPSNDNRCSYSCQFGTVPNPPNKFKLCAPHNFEDGRIAELSLFLMRLM